MDHVICYSVPVGQRSHASLAEGAKLRFLTTTQLPGSANPKQANVICFLFIWRIFCRFYDNKRQWDEIIAFTAKFQPASISLFRLMKIKIKYTLWIKKIRRRLSTAVKKIYYIMYGFFHVCIYIFQIRSSLPRKGCNKKQTWVFCDLCPSWSSLLDNQLIQSTVYQNQILYSKHFCKVEIGPNI